MSILSTIIRENLPNIQAVVYETSRYGLFNKEAEPVRIANYDWSFLEARAAQILAYSGEPRRRLYDLRVCWLP